MRSWMWLTVGACAAYMGQLAPAQPPKDEGSIQALGYIVPTRLSRVSAKTTGFVKEVLVREGDAVKAGDVLVRLDPAEPQAALDAAKAKLQFTKQNLNRLEELLKKVPGAVSEAEVQTTRAQLALDEVEVQRAQIRLDATVIRAPFAGTILKVNATVGEVVQPGAKGVCELAEITDGEVEVQVSERDVARISVGQSCKVSLVAAPKTVYEGKVTSIGQVVNRAKGTVDVRVRFAVPAAARNEARIGSSATVQFLGKH